MNAWPSGRARDGGIDEVLLPSAAGRLWLCGKHAVGPDPERALARVGADAVVCLCEEQELSARYPRYVEWLRQHAPERALWAPIPDLHALSRDQTLDLAADLRGRLATGQGLIVHCGAGIGRAGTIATALLITMGLTYPEAAERVSSSRPMAGPEAGPQVALLESLRDGN